MAYYVAEGAVIKGNITIGEDSGIWYNATIRGDSNQIAIGSRTNVQDNAVVHVSSGYPVSIGNDVTITMAAEGGQLELNAFEPIVFYCLFQSIDTLAYAVQTFVDNCVTGITANEERCRQLVENSIGVITAICPHVGYEKAAEIAKKAMKTGESIRNLILREGLLSEKEMETVLDPVNMTEPGISGKELLRK